MTFLSSLRRSVCVGAFMLGFCAFPSHAATFTVSNLDDKGDGSLRQAVLDANTDAKADTIQFASGLKGTLRLTSGELPLTSALTIQGPGSVTLVLSGNNRSRIFNVSGKGPVAISGLTLTGSKQVGQAGAAGSSHPEPFRPSGSGGVAQGGAIFNDGVLSLSDCVLTGNSISGGRGGKGADWTSYQHGNATVYGLPQPGSAGGSAQGGALYNAGILALTNTTFRGNSAIGGRGGNGGKDKYDQTATGGTGGAAMGGAIYNAGQLSQSNTTFMGNSVIAGTGGTSGGVGGNPQDKDIFDATPIANKATFTTQQWRAFQGQLVADGRGQSLTYSLVSGQLPKGLTLDSKTGAISGKPTVSGNRLTATYKVSNKIQSSNVVTITFNIKPHEEPSLVVDTTADDTTSGNSTEGAGKNSLRDAINFANSNTGSDTNQITFNLPTNTPQNIALTQGALLLTSNTRIVWTGKMPLTIAGNWGVFTIQQNATSLSGLTLTGATMSSAIDIQDSATLNISNCIVSDNNLTERFSSGVNNNGTLKVSNCTFRGNSTPSYSGVILNNKVAAIANSTFSNNSSNDGDIHSAAGLFNSGSLTVVNSTFCNNNGSGITSFSDGSLTVDSCTFTGNGIGIYASAFGSSSVNNSILVGNTNGDCSGVEATHSLIGGTYAEAGLSPKGLQDNGGSTQTIALLPTSPAIGAGQTTLNTDQRSFPRPAGQGADIGAFERQTVPPAPRISVDSPSIKEGNSAMTALTFTLTLSQASTKEVSVLVNTLQGTAKAGSDYQSVPRATVTFAPGVTKQTFTVQIVGDTVAETDEQFQLSLRSPINATLGKASGTGTILNDDSAPKSPTFTDSSGHA